MKQQIAQIQNRPIVADDIVVKITQIIIYVGSMYILALSFWKLLRLDLTESQLFFGVLLIPVLPVLFIVLGILMPLAVAPKNARPPHSPTPVPVLTVSGAADAKANAPRKCPTEK